jgi:hypothetical protein
MVPGPEERGGKFDDLFEDLDKFFAQGNPRSGRPPAGGDRPDDEDGDLLPPGWEPDIEGLDLGSEPTPREEGGGKSGRESAARREPEEGPPPDEEEETESEAAGEMTGEDWTRLRDAVGDERLEEEAETPAWPPAAETEKDLFGPEADEDLEESTFGAEPEEEERRELSLDDLR